MQRVIRTTLDKDNNLSELSKALEDGWKIIATTANEYVIDYILVKKKIVVKPKKVKKIKKKNSKADSEPIDG